MFSLARPVVRLRPASKRSIWSPAITNVLMPRRSPLNVGPPIVPSRTTFSSDSPPLVVTVWARGVASARTTARAIRDESRMLPPSDRMPERGAWRMASESALPSTPSVLITAVIFNSRMTAKLAQSVNDKTRTLTHTFDDIGKSRLQTFLIDQNANWVETAGVAPQEDGRVSRDFALA